MKYQKKVSLGAWLKKGEDYKDGDVLAIANEGEQQEGEFGIQNVFLMKTKDGKEGNVNFNQTSLNNAIDSFGNESINWIGKDVKTMVIKQMVSNKLTNVYYFLSPNTVLDEDTGRFVIQADDEIPVIETEEDPTREEAGL